MSRTAASRLLGGLATVHGQVVEAATGAGDLSTGLRTAHDGSTRLRSGVASLVSGEQDLVDGTARLAGELSGRQRARLREFGVEQLLNEVEMPLIEVLADRVDGRLVVVVSDDGPGGAAAVPGSGLAGMSDRVAALGGRLTVDSPADGGTRVRAELPCG